MIQAVRMGIDRLETVFRADGGVAKRREVEQIKQYIRENYSDSGMGVDQLAREVGMTPNYLSSIFKKNTGENLSRYLKGFRMERAREMLENTRVAEQRKHEVRFCECVLFLSELPRIFWNQPAEIPGSGGVR